jgi:signal transduction histidine kinase
MHPFIPLLVSYALITIASACTFYLSFRKQVDLSGRYFLLAELATLLMLITLMLSYSYASMEQPLMLWVANVVALAADMAILFSMYSLERKIAFKKYLLAIASIAIYCLVIEILRVKDPKSPVLIFSMGTFVIACWTCAICFSIKDAELKKNSFITCIKWTQVAIALFAVLRMASYFSNALITPRNPSNLTTVLFAVYAALGTFRYISYQSLRISWVNSKALNVNPLNKNLALAIEEKDHLLRGLIASNRVLGISALASSLAHQISQPLTALALQTDTLKRDLSKDEANTKYVRVLDKVAYQLGKLSALVKNLRQLFNARDYELDEIDLQRVTNEILEIIEPTLKSKKIRLNKTFNANPLVLGDSIQIQQVLINLFNNATDAIECSNPELREIKLTISADKAFAVISIEDSGSGIEPSQLPHLFELYKTTKKDGLGVGLWLSKTIIDKHHGTISAANHMHGGAIFTLQIPLAHQSR